MQLSLAIGLLGYIPTRETIGPILNGVMDLLKNTGSNLFLVSMHLSQVHQQQGGAWTDREVLRIGAVYNEGPNWRIPDAQAYGRVMIANKGVIIGLLG